MTIALDHLIIAVRDLERTSREFRAAGLEVVAGGKHDRQPTVNALVPCANGAYLELMSFGSPRLGGAVRLLAMTPVWQPFMSNKSSPERQIGDGLARTQGLTSVVLRVDDLDTRVTALRAAGFDVDDPTEFSRTTADGSRLVWRLAATNDPSLPILLEDITATDLRRPAGSEVGIDRVTIISEDLDRTARGYRVLLGEPSSLHTWPLGDTTIRLDSGRAEAGVPRLRARLGAPTLPRIGTALGLSHAADDPSPAAVDRLARALRLKTVSYDDQNDIDDAEFVKLGELLETSFPLVHSKLNLRKFGHSRLYRWDGIDPDRVAGLFLAHQDVVPVDDPDRWTHPPFAGVVDDEFVWGRGAIDDKSRVLALLEAMEAALEAGVTPSATLYFAFGHDEEVGGESGAAMIAEHLHRSGVCAALLLDEGGVVTRGVVDGIDRPVASIMLGEKGFVTIRLVTNDVGGHSSMPPAQTAVGRIARAVTRIQDNPLPLRTTPIIIDMVKRLAPFMSEPRRSLLAAADRLGPVITRVMTSRPQTEALVRTTTAPTVIHGGVKSNVLPQHAEAFVNFRILQGESIADVLTHCRTIVDDSEVSVEIAPGMRAEPSAITRSDDPLFELLAEVTREVVSGVAITTGLVPGATDARHYDAVAAARFNFAPIVVDQGDLDRIHGTDERLSLENYQRLIDFNSRLLSRL